MLKKITWLTCATLLCALLIALPAAQTALASEPNAAVAKIGENTYETLAAAVNDVPVDGTDPTTITLLQNASGSGIALFAKDSNNNDSSKNIIIDFAGFTYEVTSGPVGSSGTENQAFHLEKGSTVVLKNGTITNKADGVRMIVQNYCDLTLDNMVLDGSNLNNKAPYTLSLNNGVVNITGNTSILAKEGGVAFDVYYWPDGGYEEGVQVTVNTTGTISGPIELGLSRDGATSSGAAKNNKLIIQNINHEGIIKNELGSGDYDKRIVTISGGTFSESPVRYTGDTVILSGGDYYVGAQANDVLTNHNTKEATVLQAKGALTVADGIQLTNNTGRTITVNGNSLEDGGTVLIHTASTLPKTGDSANPLLWSVLLLAALLGGGLLCTGLRKRFR